MSIDYNIKSKEIKLLDCNIREYLHESDSHIFLKENTKCLFYPKKTERN